MLQMEEQSRQEQSVKEETEKINQSVEERIQFWDKEASVTFFSEK